MRKIPFSPPDLSQAEIDEVIKVLKSGWITTGPETKLLKAVLQKDVTRKRLSVFHRRPLVPNLLCVFSASVREMRLSFRHTPTRQPHQSSTMWAQSLLWLTAKAAALKWTTIKWRRQSTTIQRLSFLLTLQVLCATMTVF